MDDAALSEVFAEVFSQTDRASAIVSAALLEELIERLLLAFFLEHDCAKRDLFDGIAPLSTFGAKINTAFYLGLIEQSTFDDLKVIKNVRNDFAHSFETITFETPRIKDKCVRLKTLSETNPPQVLMDGLSTVKMFYQVNTTLLASAIHVQTGHVEHLQVYEYVYAEADDAAGSGAGESAAAGS